MLCRNFFCLKSNQYSHSESSNSRYIFVFLKTRLSSTITPHFSLIKFFARWLFREILKLSILPVFTILSATFVLYFQTTYYRHVAGAGITQAAPCRAVSRVPLSPGFPHSRGTGRDIPDTAMRQPYVSENVSQIYLQLRKSGNKNEIHQSGASNIR